MANTPNILTHKQADWIKQDYLLQLLPELNSTYLGVAARPRYKKSVQPCYRSQNIMPDTGKIWRWAKLNGTFYYSYDNIPDTPPTFYKSNLPTKKELLELNKAQATENLTEYFSNYIQQHQTAYLVAYATCKSQHQLQLSKTAAFAEAVLNYINTNNYDVRKNSLFIEAATFAQTEDLKYIPHNERKIKDRLSLIYKDGNAIAGVIKLPRTDNDNAKKYDDKEVQGWIHQLRAMGNNYTNQYIIRKIDYLCQLAEKQTPSERWIGSIMETHNNRYITAAQRFGDKSTHANKYRSTATLANAVFAGDCWQIDATRVNIIAHKANADRIGEDKAKRPQHIFMIVVRDVHSGDVLGVDYDYSENRWVYHNALAMAVKETNYLAWEIQMDKFPGHNSEEFTNFITDLEARGVKITITSTSTGKARLERHFGTLQSVFMQDSEKYYGEGIRSRRRYAHRNEQYLTSVRKRAKQEGFDFDAACNEADVIINKYRTTALSTYSRKYKNVNKSPQQLHTDSEKPNVVWVEQKSYAYLFGLKKVLDIRNGGLLRTEIYKQEFIYRIADYNIVANHAAVIVCYDLEDLSYCHLYENNNLALKPYLGIAQEEVPAQTYGPDAKWGELNKQKAIIKHIETSRKEELQLKQAVGYDVVALLTPGTSSKDEYMDAELGFVEGMQVVHSSRISNDAEASDEDVRNQY